MNVPIQAVFVDMEDVGIGDVLYLGESDADSFNIYFVLVMGEVLDELSMVQEKPSGLSVRALTRKGLFLRS